MVYLSLTTESSKGLSSNAVTVFGVPGGISSYPLSEWTQQILSQQGLSMNCGGSSRLLFMPQDSVSSALDLVLP